MKNYFIHIYNNIFFCKGTAEIRKAEGTNKLNVAGYDERELEKVLERSRREFQEGEMEEEEEEVKKEPEYFQGKSVSLGGTSAHYDPTGGLEDPQMLQVMQLSMQDVKYSQIHLFYFN